MSGRESAVTTGRKGARASARNTRARSLRPWPLTLATAVSLGLLLYVATTSLPYLVSSPTTDPNFGALNHCLSKAHPEARLGWAVSPDATRAAVYGPHAVAVCGPGDAATRRELTGTLALAFDGDNRLWLSAAGRLLREDGATLRPMGDFEPMALAGHSHGMLALDASGQLVSVAPGGTVLAQTLVPGTTGRLSVGSGGVLAAVLSEGLLRVFDTRTLTPIELDLPCAVETVWWLDEPDRLLIGCTPSGAPSFSVDVRTGMREKAPEYRSLAPARRLSGRPLYVQGCDGFPCTAPPP
ncbi:hypothetical protein FJV41_34285 [Myxococcus llanfairpwllgwyngyllgogerychwyrndrobwllllantysiliogogogochensis]|uniref:Uncharacterized protein n=1 Tax=Myxococcus llanfairpwllgwyngyllgogerychwyrndrobwllllantysiliogogogochensis TaxID=2590453 RepID=A0A540WQZ4_9BACT|nr:hypothetical protein [Myxococcus llanfairpwllgwyngyllgogerychwyrndrobwllllantysiliogogogochensis]TQF11430.1 hypothetical protein FJV41_34285 [Myxococcus llanfairpwllgwyngyllgogerychwyrndrobwllllantysiliogogogochensis]